MRFVLIHNVLVLLDINSPVNKLQSLTRRVMMIRAPIIPKAPRAIQKGVPLKLMINEQSIECLALNILFVQRDFKVESFCDEAKKNLASLSLMERAKHVAIALRNHLPTQYDEAVSILVKSLAPEEPFSEEFGLAGLFYLPHSFFISEFGCPKHKQEQHFFEHSMNAMYELTKRFTSEFAIRDFLIHQQYKTMQYLENWLMDDSPHVRRLCSEGTRPKLPWGKRLKAFIADPTPTLPFLNTLKNDSTLYVRRSVANHLGDIAKDNIKFVYSICENWLGANPSPQLKWIIRHGLRYPAKKGYKKAVLLRKLAKY